MQSNMSKVVAKELRNNKWIFSVKSDASPEQILEVIQEIKDTSNGDTKLDLQVTRKMHQIIGDYGSFFQQVRYIQLVGEKDEIMRQSRFKNAASFFRFNKTLLKTGITNNFCSNKLSKRIIAVHPSYVEYDEEIREGLKVMHRKHAADNPCFVDSCLALHEALLNCAPKATLVIDGHWVHQSSSIHGVWDIGNAETMAQHIAIIVNQHPGKVAHINLLGCESGKINPELDHLTTSNLFLKYKHAPDLEKRAAGHLRNRAVYISELGESAFDPESLAYKLLDKLHDKTIAVTATPKLLYPWPPEDPEYNIGSDTVVWKDPNQQLNFDPKQTELCVMFERLKSVTQISASSIESYNKLPWHLRLVNHAS